MPDIILASKSKVRKSILEKNKISCIVKPSNIDEEPVKISLLKKTEVFTVKLEIALGNKGYFVRVINAGVSGDTTAGGKTRLAWALSDNPQIVVLELGANDGLRGLDPRETRTNLDKILTYLNLRIMRKGL